MLKPSYTYADCVRDSIKVCWQIEDLLPEGTRLSFERNHLPDVLASTRSLTWLSEREQLALNHIRGHSYMNLFAFVEEYIIGQVVHHCEAELFGDHDALRALLRFGEEEVKHQMLFLQYCEAFRRDFGSPCAVLGAAADVANVILDKSPMAVMLVTLHLELMTQQHYTDCVRNAADVDPLVARILKHHWMEEAQHARIDVLELAKMTEYSSPDLVEKAFEEYFEIIAAFDGLLLQQVAMDIDSVQSFAGRALSDSEIERTRAVQHRSHRRDFIVLGMENHQFRRTVAAVWPESQRLLDEKVTLYSAPSEP